MKKQLLLSSALLAAVAVNAQTNKARPSISKKDPSKLAGNAALNPNVDGPTFVDENFYTIKPGQETSISEKSSSVLTPTVSWSRIAGSMNIYGMLVSETKPLQYHPVLNAVSFIHRKSATYNSIPVSNSGSMMGMISTNWGSTWDSTCIWADGTNLARYPQGGLYSAPGNTNVNNAYFAACGPVTGGSGWTGNWYASKSVTATPKNQPGTDMQFFPYSNVAGLAKHDFSRQNFVTTNDGLVRSMGRISEDPNGNSLSTLKHRGAMISKGTFNAGAMVWTGDSVIPSVTVRADGGRNLSFGQYMAWNQAGTVGYCVFIGSKTGATGTNVGPQPIVHKTTNSGSTWAPVSGIDFNCPVYDPIKKSLPAIWSSTTANTASIIPNFWGNEGLALSVDKDNRLHIFTNVQGGASPHVDTLLASYIFTTSINPGDEYNYAHTPGNRPYLYDFYGDGASFWQYRLVDSMSSEGITGTSGQNGYAENPWNEDQGSKVAVDARLQISRTPNGDGMVYSWTESDTNSTNGGKKWNNKPNLKVRVGYFNASNNYVIANNEWNLSAPPVNTGQGAVNAKAWFHYQSPVSSSITANGTVSTIRVPFTISNSSPLDQVGPNNHYYTTAVIDYTNNASVVPNPSITVCIVGIKESNPSSSISSLVIFPNPTSNNANIKLNLLESSKVSITLVNSLGQVVLTSNEQAVAGESNLNLNLNGIAKGIYFVNVKAGTQTATTKLIVE